MYFSGGGVRSSPRCKRSPVCLHSRLVPLLFFLLSAIQPILAISACEQKCKSSEECGSFYPSGCGSASCDEKSGICTYNAWVNEGCPETYVWCSGTDYLCDRKPKGLGQTKYEGKCTGWENSECIYTWCIPPSGKPKEKNEKSKKKETTTIIAEATTPTVGTTTSSLLSTASSTTNASGSATVATGTQSTQPPETTTTSAFTSTTEATTTTMETTAMSPMTTTTEESTTTQPPQTTNQLPPSTTTIATAGSIYPLDCTQPGKAFCSSDSECISSEPNPAWSGCGLTQCVQGVCYHLARRDYSSGCEDSYLICGIKCTQLRGSAPTCNAVDAKCDQGGENSVGHCSGYISDECMYRWCLEDNSTAVDPRPPPAEGVSAIVPLDCTQPGKKFCSAPTDCIDMDGLHNGVTGAPVGCGYPVCRGGICEYVTWSDDPYCGRVTCGVDCEGGSCKPVDAKCTAGPKGSFPFCEGVGGNECKYRWCPDDPLPPGNIVGPPVVEPLPDNYGPLDCSAPGRVACTSLADCIDPDGPNGGITGAPPGCGLVTCTDAGICEYDAWEDKPYCGHLECGGNDTMCVAGPKWGVGKCAGISNSSCVYRWCPLQAIALAH